MATVEQLITRIQKRIALASGMGVQVHAEEQFVEMLRAKYETLFDSRWWLETLSLHTYTLDGVDGLVYEDVSPHIKRFIDINSVFLGGNSRPLPLLQVGVNPSLHNVEAIAPYADPTKLFKVYPIDRADQVHVWSRNRLDDEAWDIEVAHETVVNFDAELLIVGTVYDYLVDDGANEAAAQKYETQYNVRYNQLVAAEFGQGVSKHNQASGVPLDWAI